jgi:Required for nuclear transport of RNA pol II C-terminus 1
MVVLGAVLQMIISLWDRELLQSPEESILVCQEIFSSYGHERQSNGVLNFVPSLEMEDEGHEILLMGIQLLSSVVAESISRPLPESELTLLKSCLPALELLSRGTHAKQVTELISLLHARIEMTLPTKEPPPETDQEKYALGMKYISDPIVPVRAQGLAILRDLILSHSAIIHPDVILPKLIALLEDEDSYVYLNAIKSLQQLADIHGKEITSQILAKYSSQTSNLELKLRLAETLSVILRRMGETFTGPLAKTLISILTSLISHETDWRVRVSAIGLLSVAAELSPREADPGVEMAVHVLRVRDLTFAEEGEGTAPVKRAALTFLGTVVRVAGVEGLGRWSREVVRGVRYVARGDTDGRVRELADEVLGLLGQEIEVPRQEWTGPRIQEL